MAKSKVFAEYDLTDKGQEGFAKGVRTLAPLSPEQWKKFGDVLPSLIDAPNDKLRDGIIDTLASAIGIGIPDVRSAMRAVEVLSGVFRLKEFANETPEAIVADLQAADLITEDRSSQFVEFLADLASQAPALKNESRRIAAAQSGLPAMKGLTLAVSFRPVFDIDYEVYSPAVDYRPHCIGVVPVITGLMTLDAGSVDQVSFSITPRHAAALIEHLRASLNELDAARELLGLNPDRREAAE